MNHILIVSEEQDVSTNKIIEYINYYGGKVKRINEEIGVNEISISLDNNSFISSISISEKQIPVNETTNLYRRGLFKYQITIPQSFEKIEGFDKFFSKECSLTNAFIFKSSNFVGNYILETENNKLYNLLAAKHIGLHIPNTIVTTNKKKALDFFRKNKEIITKPIHNGHINFSTESNIISSTGTRIATIKDIEKLANSFAPMLLQQRILKKLEIRTFFFNNRFFSMAIFSQNDKKTELDYRNYNMKKPNRQVPFKLPKQVEKKLKALLKHLNLNTASLDLILTPTYEYIFLEINPTGQYDWLSVNCNYYLDEIIAKNLISKKGKNENIIPQ